MMNRAAFLASATAADAAAVLPGANASAATPKARNVVLVHGLFADGSCWSDVIGKLLEAGLHPTAVQNPLTTLEDAVAETRRVLSEQDGPTVLVGHSWSGTLVSETGMDPKVTALVYVAARAPDAGEDFAALAKGFPAPPASSGLVEDGDVVRLSEEAFLRDFAGDVPRDRARVLYAVQQPYHKGLLTGRTTQAAWHSKPCFYAVSSDDRTIDPSLERFLAKRMNAQTIELGSSHLPMISHATDIANLIVRATLA